MDDSGTPAEDGRWLTYAELAELRGITRKAAIRLTQRHQWRRQPGNDGSTRVLVPADIERRQTPRDGGTSDDGFSMKALTTLETALSALRGAKDGEIAAKDAVIAAKDGEIASLRERSDRAETRADRAEAALTAERSRVDELMADVAAAEAATERARHEAQVNHDAVEDLRQTETERRARGRWSRLRAAWRGE